MTYLTNRAGLLIERQQGQVYAFPHRTFQEYLAACHLAATDFPYLLADRLREDDGRWREASLLAAARAVTGSPAPIWNLAAGFCPQDVPVPQAGGLRHVTDPDWYAALRAAEALIETELHRNVPERQAYLVERLRGWLLALVEGGHLPPAERAAAGDALGRLGDPRRGVGLNAAGVPDIAWCEVPAGGFIMGSKDDSEPYLGKETPQQKIDLPGYRIGKYLITVAQYEAFVRDGGYTALAALLDGCGLAVERKTNGTGEVRRRLRPAEPSGGECDLVRGDGVLRLAEREAGPSRNLALGGAVGEGSARP